MFRRPSRLIETVGRVRYWEGTITTKTVDGELFHRNVKSVQSLRDAGGEA